MSIKFVNYDAENKSDFDFRSIISEEINNRDFENKAETINFREYAFDSYRDRYILVINDDVVIGYLIYGNERLFKSSIIKYYYFYENYKEDTYVKQVILEFMNRDNNISTCILHELDCDLLIQLGLSNQA